MAAAAGAVAAVGSTGSVAAQEEISGLDWDNELSPDPVIPGSQTVDEHVGGRPDLSYTDDNGDQSSLREHGYRLVEADESGDVPEAANSVTIAAANIHADEFTDWPRGQTFTNSDDEEEDVSGLDAQHWTDSGMSTSDGSGDSLDLSASADGDSTRFEDVEIESGIDRKRLQLVVDVDSVDSEVEIRVEDSSANQKIVSIDPDGDASTDSVLIASTGDSRVGQVPLGDLSTDLDDIAAVEIAAVGGAAELTIHGLNLDRESEWEFGTEQIVNSDDELDEETVREPNGDFSIMSLDTLPDYFAEADIDSVSYDVEIHASGLDDEHVWIRSTEASDVSSYEQILEIYYQFEVPTAYDLSDATIDSLDYESGWPSDRFDRLDAADGYGALDPEEDDWDDVDEISWTDKTAIVSRDEEVELLSGLSASDVVGFRAEIPMSSDRLDSLTTSGSTAAVGVSGGGPLAQLGSYANWIFGGLVAGGVIFRKRLLGWIGS